MAHKQMKRCSPLYVIRELQIETTRHYYAPIRMAAVQNTGTPNAGEDMEQ